MAVKRKIKDRSKRVSIPIRMSSEEKDLLDLVSKVDGKSLAAFVMNLALSEAKLRAFRLSELSFLKESIPNPFDTEYGDANRSPLYLKKTLRELPFVEFKNSFWYFKDNKIAIIPMVQSVLSGERTIEEFADMLNKNPEDIKKCVKFFVKNREEFSEWQKQKAAK